MLKRVYEAMPGSTPDLKAWFGDQWDTTAAYAALDNVIAWMMFVYGAAPIRRTPAGTGSALLEFTLPERITYPSLPDGIMLNLHQNSFPHRWQEFSPDKGIEYDARSAFVGCCRHVPVYFGGELQHDQRNEYIPYRPARYLVDVTVPADWRHIGLVPGPHNGEAQRDYPDKPGCEWRVWLDGQEVDLLRARAWPHVIRERLVFAPPDDRGCDPLRKWVEPIRGMLERIEHHPRWSDPVTKATRWAIRAVCLQTIGLFHRGDGERVIVDPETGAVDVVTVALDERSARFHHPEWSAAIWSRSRVRTTRKALETTRDNIISIHGDAIMVRTAVPGWDQDDGKIGTFRRK